MHVYQTSIHGNPNVGLYGFANDHFCLLGHDVPETQARKIERALNVPVHQLTLCGTSMIGAFCNGNNKCIVIPHIVFDEETSVLDRLKIKYRLIKTRHTALGNNLLCNDNGCLANPEMGADSKKLIRQALGVPLKPGMIADVNTVGSVAIHNKYGCIVHRDAKQFEIKFIKDLLKINIETGTVNMGNPYLGAGVICNSNGFVVGDQSGGPEVVNIDENLGFLEKYRQEN
ncbi:translation initiation factor IF-6 [Candidatus Woesearchaeota archaeon CG10_big_fil_rev_8_21_14_0_10_44_13]|nr:MAG: translation initiation factor IF-6 [Candidatus Woesearchaeota archaeon CG10_big_fil_rev_8_21_14_0_10_44_13]